MNEHSIRRPPSDELAAAYAAASGLLLSEHTVSAALAVISSLAVDVLPPSCGAGISLLDDRGCRTTSAATDPIVERADLVQYELGEGPCLSAWADHVLIRIDNLGREQRWPQWVPRAVDLGLAASLSAPVLAAGQCLGAIKVYSQRPHAYGATGESLLRRFAEQTSILLVHMHTAQTAQRLSADLQHALQTRDTIAVARGILVARHRIDPDHAYRRLIDLSEREHLSLRQIAQRIVDSSARPAEQQ
ncbi:GAF and ANTAR domain-containing protein [Nocardia sp. CDC159]|uniref:GAF and ANTAR domain-containing protein n=1 Tax=Nocardia pulmonis TaxID=2951408 RepID=A0A9X2J1L7_9NOCA|nr:MULTISPECIES: GAF and ANTAR domain-containing protein [Nocardia]MCM6779004.1 GAF and ANTAR domain-containing protein [Nocardia pulmonis]MCM6791900.1 GAF and ANTAR domain-containing protein [Nocardia sp. CDC159]